YEHPVKLDSFWSQKWQASVIWCRQAQNPGEAHQRRAADRLGAKWAELDTGHYPMLSMPDELTRLLLAGVRGAASRDVRPSRRRSAPPQSLTGNELGDFSEL